MPHLSRQLGFCLVCGNSVNADQEFHMAKNGYCHDSCLNKLQNRA